MLKLNLIIILMNFKDMHQEKVKSLRIGDLKQELLFMVQVQHVWYFHHHVLLFMLQLLEYLKVKLKMNRIKLMELLFYFQHTL